MKNHLLTLTVICLTALLTFWIFLGFRKKESDATAFQSIVGNTPLSLRHLFLAPAQLGVDTWEVGDYSKYRLESNMYSREITFHVAAAVDESSHEKWLRTLGVIEINRTDVEVWRLLNTRSIRPEGGKAEVLFAEGAIPFYTHPRGAVPYPAYLEYIGEEDVETAIGTFKCQHYFARLGSPDGHKVPLLELWSNASVAPLGIVRARWQDEVFELIETQSGYPFEIPEMLGQMMSMPDAANAESQVNQSKSDCSSCHDGGVGGEDLKQENLFAISGKQLNVTESLYHYRRSELFQQDDLLGFRLRRERDQQQASDGIRFTWEKGSFEIKPGIVGQVAVSLDEIAHEGNIHVASYKSRLILHPSIKTY